MGRPVELLINTNQLEIIMFRFIKYWWYELLEFIFPDRTSDWSEEDKKKYAAYKRKNLRL